MATKRLKELLEARKSSPRDHSGRTSSGCVSVYYILEFTNYCLSLSVYSNGHLQPGQVMSYT